MKQLNLAFATGGKQDLLLEQFMPSTQTKLRITKMDILN